MYKRKLPFKVTPPIFHTHPSYYEYRRKLNKFYKHLNYMQFMLNKREIARQDVLLTPDGPIELYRRDADGKEKLFRPNYSKGKYRSRASLLKEGNNYYDFFDNVYRRHGSHHSRERDDDLSIYGGTTQSSVYRDPSGRYGIAFDWYNSNSRRSRTLYENVQVMPPRRRFTSVVPDYDRYVRSSSSIVSSGSRSSSYIQKRRRRPVIYDYFDDGDIFNSRDYDIYQYYEYDGEESSVNSSRPRRYIVKSPNSSSSRGSNRTPIPPERHKVRKIISYIDYDRKKSQNSTTSSSSTSDDSKNYSVKRHRKSIAYRNEEKNKKNDNAKNNDSSSLSSSASGKELWKKVDKYAKHENTPKSKHDLYSSTNRNNKKEDKSKRLSNKISERSDSRNDEKNRINDKNDPSSSNFILVNSNKNINKSPNQSNSSQIYDFSTNNINNRRNSSNKSNDSLNKIYNNNRNNQTTPIFTDYVNKNTSSNMGYQGNFKKFGSNFKGLSNEQNKRNQVDSQFNDIPGNNFVRTNPLFNTNTNDSFMF